MYDNRCSTVSKNGRGELRAAYITRCQPGQFNKQLPADLKDSSEDTANKAPSIMYHLLGTPVIEMSEEQDMKTWFRKQETQPSTMPILVAAVHHNPVYYMPVPHQPSPYPAPKRSNSLNLPRTYSAYPHSRSLSL
ncbi:uncharacterized protein LOC123519707 [Portunus trituberculatus]|uniref:uncharacterized protein LOC123519707 n=1 Tax=Portunus trituberculatus TaxID=210409 RepID=UPI001E1D192B|nr:uncharacterized protein LOC123519707 [Portunus trituberculatus]